MKKIVFLFVSFFAFSLFVHAEPTDAQIQAAAATLGVSFDALKKFVLSQQTLSAPSDIIKVQAFDLYKEFKDNTLKAESKYKNKNIQITGVVENISQEYNSAGQKAYCIKLKTDAYMALLYVFFKESELDKIIDIDSGDTVTCVGRYTAFKTLPLYFENAYLVK